MVVVVCEFTAQLTVTHHNNTTRRHGGPAHSRNATGHGEQRHPARMRSLPGECRAEGPVRAAVGLRRAAVR